MKHSTRYSNFLTNNKDQTIYEHVKNLPFGESVYEPENGFDKFQLIQLGEGSREFKSALQYFVQELKFSESFKLKILTLKVKFTTIAQIYLSF